MLSALKLLKDCLLNIVKDIDNGNSNLTEDELEEALDLLRMFARTDGKISKYQAIKYLGVSRATFDNYVRAGKLPKGKKQQGFKELF